MLRPVLDHPAFERHFTPAHRDLRQRALDYFQASRLPEWVHGPGGHLTKAQWEELGRLGFLGASLPRELGGQGLGLLGALILGEAAAQVGDLGVSLGLHCQTEITAQWLATAHDAEVRDRYLPGMSAGRLVGCACDTEPGGQMQSTAVRDGDELVVHARKLYVVNGFNADLCFVTLKLEGESATVLVEKERPGVRVLKVFDKLGTRSIDSAMIDFDAVRVPAANLSTKRGVRQLMQWNKVMTAARFLMCADACFLHGRLLDRMLEYAGARIVDGRPLSSWPVNRHALARAAADQELMRAGLIDRFEQLENRRNAVAEVAALKWFCVDRTAGFAALCAEMHGGAGYMWDSEFLIGQAQILGLKMAGGSLTTMKAIAGQALAYREELEALG
ncbi:MAG TPA: acyl-CoA dehydrogenase family protein [Thermoanaerobaculia bacterium]|nr:acyl-CoA dehydrogenase family protein [Thermoanaerobaculia bacterium]